LAASIGCCKISKPARLETGAIQPQMQAASGRVQRGQCGRDGKGLFTRET
jgi:hypothetical protein